MLIRPFLEILDPDPGFLLQGLFRISEDSHSDPDFVNTKPEPGSVKMRSDPDPVNLRT